MLQKQINLAEKCFLSDADLSYQQLENVLSSIVNKKSIDYADLYFQAVTSEQWYLEDNIIKSGSYNYHKGLGVRAIEHDKTGVAFSENICLDTIQQAADAARSIAIHNINTAPYKIASNIKKKPNQQHIDTLYSLDNPLLSISDQKKTELLQTINSLARDQDSRITQVIASLVGSHEIILIMNHLGLIKADVRPLIRLNIQVIAEDTTSKNQRTQGIGGGGGRFASYKLFTENDSALAKSFIKKATHIALTNLNAQAAPAGSMPVILASGWPGILLHEAIGHGLEGDAIRKGSSAFSNKMGEKIASNLCTIVDNGSLPQQRGSLNIDDEGTPTQNTILIENGILKNYLQDNLNAKLMKQSSTGNARRQSYAYPPIPRMTNTYMLPGISDPQEIIKSVNYGIYAVSFAGGQVDVTSGKFVFEANEAYLIKNGQITNPIKGATLIGNGPEILKKITMVGNDLLLDPGIGTCGKDGQNVPVGVGQPTLLINELTVGGTEC